MKKIYTNIFLFLFTTAIVISSLNSASGPTQIGYTVTGAPFGSFPNTTCNNCHSGGSFGASVSLALFSGATQVSNYTPGAVYTVRLTRTGSGIPAIGGFGFQMTCATTPGNVNNNTWGSLPATTANRLLSSRNYIEHTAKLPSSTTQLNFTWTAPATNQGSLKFYVAMNTVNGDGSTPGDQVVSNTLTIPINPLPVTLLYFTGINQKVNNKLEWATTDEVNSGHFTLEKSANGENFMPVYEVNAITEQMDTKKYSYMDMNVTGSPYYRVKYISVSNEELYYKTIQIKSGNNPGAFHYIQDGKIMIQLSNMDAQRSTLCIIGINGQLVKETGFDLSVGNNTLGINQPDKPGIYLLTLTSANHELIYSGKVWVE